MDSVNILMSKAEMLERLEAGERAIDLAVEKWQRIVGYGKISGIKYLPFDGGSTTCALCCVHSSCKRCPYYHYHGRACCDIAGHWYIWRARRNLSSARAMLNALIEIPEEMDLPCVTQKEK